MVGEEDADLLRDPQHELKAKVVDDAARTCSPTSTRTRSWPHRRRHLRRRRPRPPLDAPDPIDGTKGFLRLEQYAVALALVEDGEGRARRPRLPEPPLRSRAAPRPVRTPPRRRPRRGI
ncbi:MAG: inositol monophosphatase family protein [Myxococcota bacterium]